MRFDSFDVDSRSRPPCKTSRPPARCRCWWTVTWRCDTLAIAEYLAEQFADKHCGPLTRAMRVPRTQRLRQKCTAAFTALRSACPMNIRSPPAHRGRAGLARQTRRTRRRAAPSNMWSELLRSHGGPMLFGDFTIADAYFAPICMRMQTSYVPCPAPDVAAYVGRVGALPGVHAWVSAALAEKTSSTLKNRTDAPLESALGELRWRCTWSVVRYATP